jgi:hypothetical protein
MEVQSFQNHLTIFLCYNLDGQSRMHGTTTEKGKNRRDTLLYWEEVVLQKTVTIDSKLVWRLASRVLARQ